MNKPRSREPVTEYVVKNCRTPCRGRIQSSGGGGGFGGRVRRDGTSITCDMAATIPCQHLLCGYHVNTAPCWPSRVGLGAPGQLITHRVHFRGSAVACREGEEAFGRVKRLT